MKVFTYITTIIIVSGFFIIVAVPAEENEESAVKQVIIESYIDGMFIKGDSDAIRQGFHKDCLFYSYAYSDVAKQSITHWIDHFSKNPAPLNQFASYSFEFIRVEGYVAVAAVKLMFDDCHVSTEYLTLYKLKDGWNIISKVDYFPDYQYPEDRQVVAVDPKIYQDYVGQYELSSQVWISISTHDDVLYAEQPHHGPVELFPESETTFFTNVVAGTITFVRDDDGPVTGLVLTHDQHSQMLRRVEPRVAVLTGQKITFEVSEIISGPHETAKIAFNKMKGVTGATILPAHEKGMSDGFYIVKESTIISTQDLESVRKSIPPDGEPSIMFSLKSDAAQRLKEYTKSNIGKRLALILDRKVVSGPRVAAVISKHGMINGHFTEDEADRIIQILRLSIAGYQTPQ